MNFPTFDHTYGALTLFYDSISAGEKESSDMRDNLNDIFPAGQLLYKKAVDLPNAETIIEDIREENDNLAVDLPESGRFVFSWYLDLSQLTEEWLTAFFENARRFGELQPPNSPTDQHNVLCFRYRIHTISREEQERIYPLLTRIAQDTSISKEIFLLHATALQKFDRQERGIAQYLFLISRLNNGEIFSTIAGNQSQLRVITYSDFYEDRVKRCDEEISRIDTYLNTPADPKLEGLIGDARDLVHEASNKYQNVLRSFRMRESLFPVNVEDFVLEGSLFSKSYHSAISRDDPRLMKARQRYMKAHEDQILQNFHAEKITEEIENEQAFHDPDITALKTFLDDDGTQLQLLSFQNGGNVSEEEIAFRKRASGEILDAISKCSVLRSQDAKRTKYESRRKHFQKEKREAGIFTSLQDCCNRIGQKTQFGGLQGRLGMQLYENVLINPRCASELINQTIELRDINTEPRISIDIEPEEIALTRIFGLLDLGREDSVETLYKVLV